MAMPRAASVTLPASHRPLTHDGASSSGVMVVGAGRGRGAGRGDEGDGLPKAATRYGGGQGAGLVGEVEGHQEAFVVVPTLQAHDAVAYRVMNDLALDQGGMVTAEGEEGAIGVEQ